MFSNLPIPKPGHEVLAEGFSKMLENLMKQKQFENEAQNRNATLKLAAQKESREQALSPIYQQYYQSQIPQHQLAAQKTQQEIDQNNMINNLIRGEVNQGGTSSHPGQPGQSNQPGQSGKLKISPALAAMIKQKTGYDVYAQTPEEKTAMEIRKNMELTEAKANIKTAQTIQNSARDLQAVRNLALQAKEIIKNHPGNTGWIEGARISTKASKNEYANKLNTIFGEIQGRASRLYNPRGGIGSINWTKSIKPSVYGTDEGNIAMLDAILEGVDTTMNQYNDEHKDLTQKELPIKNSKNVIPEKAKFEIYDPKGKHIGYMTEENSNKFLNAHKGYYRKARKNG